MPEPLRWNFATLSLLTGLLLILPASACQADEEPRPAVCADFAGSTELPDIPLAYSTKHLDIHVEEGRIMCAGTPHEYERFYQFIADELAIMLTHRSSVFITSVSEHCGPETIGCRQPDGVVFASAGVTWHEMAHAASCDWRYSSAPPLVEGLAVAFEPSPLTSKVDPYEFIEGKRREFGPYYDRAGHFVRWLLEERGPEALRRAYVASPVAGGGTILSVLADAYAQEVDALFAEYLASAPYMWVPYRQCADVPKLERKSGVWEFEATYDCDDPSTFGPWERLSTEYFPGADTSMYQSFLIEVDTDGTYHFEREIETGVWLERCLDETGLTEDQAANLWFKQGLVPTLQGTTDIVLERATYRVDVLRDFGPPHPVSLRIEGVPG